MAPLQGLSTISDTIAGLMKPEPYGTRRAGFIDVITDGRYQSYGDVDMTDDLLGIGLTAQTDKLFSHIDDIAFGDHRILAKISAVCC